MNHLLVLYKIVISVPTLSVTAAALIVATVETSELYQARSPLFPLVSELEADKANVAPFALST